ncbi:MAG: hypothetical protein GKR93_01220 [Gammaproteobacteria bacterium]|nr:hypothetical protein [Gammaproteobacteria bacterium]
MYLNLKSTLVIQFILCVSCHQFCLADTVISQRNYAHASQGSWYGDVNLLGAVDRNGFSKAPYSNWFLSEYKDYLPNRNVIENIKKNRISNLDDLEITVFMGTWCSDSKKQTPRLYKILDQLDFDETRMSVHAVDIRPETFRKTPDGLAEKDMNVYRVPTIIVKRNNQEIGRIVESPVTTLELDMLKILKQESDSRTHFILEGEVNNYLEKYGTNGFEKNIETLAGEFREKGIKEHELNHYIAYNLLYSKRYREAELVIRMMLNVYPEAGHLHMALAKTYELLNNDKLALNSYKKAFLYHEKNGKMSIFRDAISRSQTFE